MIRTSFKYLFVAFLCLTASISCNNDDKEECSPEVNTANVPNLVKIYPLQEQYNVGDEVFFSCTIRSINSYFNGQEQNIYDIVKNDYARLVMLNAYNLFFYNEVSYIKGKEGDYPNWFYLSYNPDTKLYELLAKIKFTQARTYSFLSQDNVQFRGVGGCKEYLINTTVEGINSDGKIEFEVQ